MDGSTTKPQSNSKLSSICEAMSLVSITLLLIGIYLSTSSSIEGAWLVLFGFLVVIGIAGSIAASYRQIKTTSRTAETRNFRVTRQLVETLIAKQLPSDVIFGLKKMIKDGDQPFQGETTFLKQLEATLGIERTSEVQAMILKYARVPEGESTAEITPPPPPAETTPPPLPDKAMGAVG